MASLRHTFSRDRNHMALDGAADDPAHLAHSSPMPRHASASRGDRTIVSNSSPTTVPKLRRTVTGTAIIEPAPKVDHDGIKGVPVGPARVRVPFIERMRSLPHISIPVVGMDGSNAILSRLQDYLSDTGAIHIVKDGAGYYIVFSDSEDGRENLHHCFRRYNGRVFLERFRLTMTCHPYGLTGVARAEWLADRVARVKEHENEAAAHQELRPMEDCSSVVSSNKTLSSASKSRRPRCFVCKNDAAYRPSGLVQCSTCTKLYHHSCHSGSNAPELQADRNQHWICNSCVKKTNDLRAAGTGGTEQQVLSNQAPISARCDTVQAKQPTPSTPAQGATVAAQKPGRIPVSSSPSREANRLVETSFTSAPPVAGTAKPGASRFQLSRTKKTPDGERVKTLPTVDNNRAQDILSDAALASNTKATPQRVSHVSGTAAVPVERVAPHARQNPADLGVNEMLPAVQKSIAQPDGVSTKPTKPTMAKRGGFKGLIGSRTSKVVEASPSLGTPSLTVVAQGLLPAAATEDTQMTGLSKPCPVTTKAVARAKIQDEKPRSLQDLALPRAASQPKLKGPKEPASVPAMTAADAIGTKVAVKATAPALQPQAWTEAKLAQIKTQLGDSHSRPRGTARMCLVGMALASAKGHRLQSIGVNKWVATNILTYKLGEGDWESSLSALLSTGQSKGPNVGYWRQYEWTPGSGGIGTGAWWELLPGKVDEMWHWDAQRKQPIEPFRALSSGPTGTSVKKGVPGATARGIKRRTSSQATSPANSPLLLPTDRVAKRKKTAGMQSNFVSGRTDTPLADLPSIFYEKDPATNGHDQTSSEDEPIMKKRKKSMGLASTLEVATNPSPEFTQAGPAISRPERPPPANMISEKPAVDQKPDMVKPGLIAKQANGPTAADSKSLIPAIPNPPAEPKLQSTTVETDLAEYIARHTGQLDYSAGSLFTEWPQYRPPHGQVGTGTSTRLTRKQLFGKPACYSSLRPSDPPAQPASPTKRTTASPEKRPRAIVDAKPGDPYPWEEEMTDDGDERKEVGSFEELLGLSDDPVVKILWEGGLAYREEVRMESGRLARGHGVYATGYVR